MKPTRPTRRLIASALALSAALSGCVELSRTEKMSTYSGGGKSGRTIPGNQSQDLPKQQEFPSK